MYNKLTRGELRIIEETKREGELARAEQGPGKQNNLGRKPVRAVLSLLALVLIFCLMAFVAWLVFNSFS